MGWLLGPLAGFVAWLAERLLGWRLAPPSPAQQAVDIERKMAQDVARHTSKDDAIKALENGDA